MISEIRYIGNLACTIAIIITGIVKPGSHRQRADFQNEETDGIINRLAYLARPCSAID
jgi:hypothetical protein